MTMPIRSGVLLVGTIVYLVGDDGSAVVQADYPDATTAQQAASDLAAQSGVTLLDPNTYGLYVTTSVSTQVPTSGVTPPSRPGRVPPNYPSQRGQANG